MYMYTHVHVHIHEHTVLYAPLHMYSTVQYSTVQYSTVLLVHTGLIVFMHNMFMCTAQRTSNLRKRQRTGERKKHSMLYNKLKFTKCT